MKTMVYDELNSTCENALLSFTDSQIPLMVTNEWYQGANYDRDLTTMRDLAKFGPNAKFELHIGQICNHCQLSSIYL